MITLGIETSCDETSIAILENDKVLANLISSQHFHAEFGGVVPELSSRAHLQIVSHLLRQSLKESGLKIEEVDVISATAGPGLIGALLVGLNFAKGLSLAQGKPFVPVNHIEGHIFSGFLMDEKPEFPFLSLVVSGGHTLLLLVKNDLEIYKLGSTIDDAAGEAFDKAAKMLNLGYPGGPKIQEYAEKGNENAIDFPVAQLKTPYDFSFSGLKTAVLRYAQKNYIGNIPEVDLPDIAASFQKAVSDALTRRVNKALKNYSVKSVSIVGGVAANKKIKNRLQEISQKYNKKLVVPDLQFCGDNAAMIAYRGYKLFLEGKRFDLDSNAFPALPADIFLPITD